MKIVVVGVGALGSHLVQAIRNVPAEIHVIDFDSVESKNEASQFHGKPGRGKNKTTAIAQTMSFLWGKTIYKSGVKLAHDNVKQLLGGAGLLVDCLDNAASRLLVQTYARENGIPCVHGALAPNGEYGQVSWGDHFKVDSEVGQGGATCENGLHLPFIMIVSCWLAKAVSDFAVNGLRRGYAVSPSGVQVTTSEKR